MKRTTTLFAVTALAALCSAGLTFAGGGSMGGSQAHGNMSGTHQMTSTMPGTGGSMQGGSGSHGQGGHADMQPNGAGMEQGHGHGSAGTQGMMQNGPENRHEQMNGSGDGTTDGQPAATPSGN